MPARDLVREAIEWKVEVDSSGQIVVFKQVSLMEWGDEGDDRIAGGRERGGKMGIWELIGSDGMSVCGK